MSRLAMGLLVAAGAIGLVFAFAPPERAAYAGGQIDQHGNTVYLADEPDSIQAPFVEKSSTGLLIREIREMDRTNCGDPSMEAEECGKRIGNRQLELMDRCDAGESAACIKS